MPRPTTFRRQRRKVHRVRAVRVLASTTTPQAVDIPLTKIRGAAASATDGTLIRTKFELVRIVNSATPGTTTMSASVIDSSIAATTGPFPGAGASADDLAYAYIWTRDTFMLGSVEVPPGDLLQRVDESKSNRIMTKDDVLRIMHASDGATSTANLVITLWFKEPKG